MGRSHKRPLAIDSAMINLMEIQTVNKNKRKKQYKEFGKGLLYLIHDGSKPVFRYVGNLVEKQKSKKKTKHKRRKKTKKRTKRIKIVV